MQQLAIGTLLRGGTYKIEKVLGQGSFGITYLAEHTGLKRNVAIKEFFMKELNSRGDDGSITGMTDGSLSHSYCAKFQREAINLSRLDHPNIVRVTDSFSENGTFYYVMDYIEGQNLNDYVKTRRVDEMEAVSIIKPVADALIYMHEEKHMLHLDLKPGNVMRRESDGHIFLIDFGLSKHYDENGQPETSTNIGLGTAGYAPIEQNNQAKSGEFRPTIDVYALGATFYKLLIGETPPAASDLVNDDELLEGNLRAKGVSENLIKVVTAAMCPNVKKRTQTIRDFKNNLCSTSVSPTTGKTHEENYGANYTEDTILVDDKTITGNGTSTETNETQKQEAAQGKEKKAEKTNYNKGNWLVPTFFIIIILLVAVGSFSHYKGQKEEEENKNKEAIENATKDWYVDEADSVYCLIGSEKHFVDFYGIPDGQRDIHYATGGIESFSGTVVNGRKAKGLLRYRNGDYFNGTLRSTIIDNDDIIDNGHGRITIGGRVYEGDFKSGLFDGQGTYANADGTWFYKGNFASGEFNGSGQEFWPKEKRKNYASSLDCNYNSGMRNGVGIWYYNDHTYQKCKFKNGKQVAVLEYGTWK